MGYLITMMVVRPSVSGSGYHSVEGSVQLGKFAYDGPVAELINRAYSRGERWGNHPNRPYIYWENGDKESYGDYYGEALALTTFIEAIEAIRAVRDKWGAHTLALNILREFYRNSRDPDELRVIFWGH